MKLSKVDAMLIWEQLKKERKPMSAERRTLIIQRLKMCKHKKGVDRNDWDKVNNNLLLIAEFDLDLCEAFGMYHEFTRIIDKPIEGVSVSNAHDRRAYDRTLRGWTNEEAEWFVPLVNDGLTIGAVSKSDGKEREAVFEDDTFKIKDGKKFQTKWRHLHFQCRF